jgi:hypothetical protein
MDLVLAIVKSINEGTGKALFVFLGAAVASCGLYVAFKGKRAGRGDTFEEARAKLVELMSENDRQIDRLSIKADMLTNELEQVLSSIPDGPLRDEAARSLEPTRGFEENLRRLLSSSRGGVTTEVVIEMTNNEEALTAVRRLRNSERVAAGHLSSSSYDQVFAPIEDLIAQFKKP